MITRSLTRHIRINAGLYMFKQYTADSLRRLRTDISAAYSLMSETETETKNKRHSRFENERWCADNILYILRAMTQRRIDLNDSRRYPRKKEPHSAAGHYAIFRKICIEEQRRNPTMVTALDMKTKQSILKILPGKCCYCRRQRATEYDHWHCISCYGADNDLNRVPACRSCNLKKGSATPEHYIQTLRVGSKRSRSVAMRLEQFERHFKGTGRLDCQENVKRRLKRYRPMVKKCFQLINQMVDNQAFLEVTTNPDHFMLQSFKSILGK